jgi:hypothetical protein
MTGPQHLPVIGVFEKRLFSSDALDLVPDFQRAVVFAESELFEFRPERAD